LGGGRRQRLDERRTVVSRRLRDGRRYFPLSVQRREVEIEPVEDPPCRRRSDALEELENAEPADLILSRLGLLP